MKNRAGPMIPVGLLSGNSIHIAFVGVEPGPQNGPVSIAEFSMVCGSGLNVDAHAQGGKTCSVDQPTVVGTRTNESLSPTWPHQVQRIPQGRHAMPFPRTPSSNTAPATLRIPHLGAPSTTTTPAPPMHRQRSGTPTRPSLPTPVPNHSRSCVLANGATYSILLQITPWRAPKRPYSSSREVPQHPNDLLGLS